MTTNEHHTNSANGTHGTDRADSTHGTRSTGGTVLVTSATGKTGRRVAALLTERGVPVRAGSRTPRSTDGAEGVAFDWASPATWPGALRGVRAAQLSYYPDLSVPVAAEALKLFGTTAADAGVERLVLLSGRGEPGAVAAEEALRSSGVDLTVVRGAFFAQNFSEGLLRDAVRYGGIAFPAGDTPEPFVDTDDLAEMMVVALTEEGHRGRIYEATGPRLLTFTQAAGELSLAAGHAVRYIPVSGEEFGRVLTGSGLPAEDVAWLTELCVGLMDGHNAATTEDVRAVLGRPPRDFAEFARRAAASGVWRP
ncbi:NAD(P)H-binding protein [Streptomyces sp. NPDC000594]|uniref:NAD(P)H-binding protein n=1 Tax=Streptomyces sp. NPDC000594 TaxID=3154261 RepID=UPI0033301F70